MKHSDRVKATELIDEAREAGARLIPACKVLNISARTYSRWVGSDRIEEDKRKNACRLAPKNKLTEAERKEIIRISNTAEFTSMPPSKIVPKLADKGVYVASESTFYRVLHEEKMMSKRGKAKYSRTKVPTTHIATKENQVWTWDITYLPGFILGLYFKLYLILDIFSRKIVGYEVWETETAANAEILIKKAVLTENIAGKPLVLHSDNGTPMKGATFQRTLEFLGITKSYSRPRVSNDNPFSESIFRTLKYAPIFPEKGFSSLENSRKWVHEFVKWYNDEHFHSGLKFVTPNQRHSGEADAIMEARIEVYEAARRRHPERWSRHTRNWTLPEFVALNPTNKEDVLVAKNSTA
ncbi:MAG: IS3 family transposase [Alkaliphilus sp.]